MLSYFFFLKTSHTVFGWTHIFRKDLFKLLEKILSAPVYLLHKISCIGKQRWASRKVEIGSDLKLSRIRNNAVISDFLKIFAAIIY
jgi:hypothetical protein